MNSYNEVIVGNGFFTFFYSYIIWNRACVISGFVNIILCVDEKENADGSIIGQPHVSSFN